MNNIVDHQERALALAPSQSLAISAPAGSGKTGLLTQRVLKLLSIVNKPEDILAITFTRKAAGEMKDRILKALRTAATQAPPQQPHEQTTYQLAKAALARDTAQSWQLLDNPHRLRIQTIDGLCASLARQLPMLSQLGALPDVTDQTTRYYQEAIATLLASLESKQPWCAALAQMITHLDNDYTKIERLLINLLAKRDQWLPYLGTLQDSPSVKHELETTFKVLLEDSLIEAEALFGELGAYLLPLARFAASHLALEKPDSSICACENLTTLPGKEPTEATMAAWRGLAELLLTKSSSTPKAASWRKPRGVNKTIGFPLGNSKEEKAHFKEVKQQFQALLETLESDPQSEARLEVLNTLRLLPPLHYSDAQWALLQALATVLPVLVAQLTVTFREQGVCDYTEITHAALRALGSEEAPSDLALLLDHKIQHILVDEFQDTSAVQIQLLEKLTQGWTKNDGRSLFIVGDGMQSCYAFRAANVSLFLAARQFGIGELPLKALDLKLNFRSQAGMIEWVNRVFIDAFPAQANISRGAVPYIDTTAFHPALAGHAVACHGFLDQDDRQAEANKIIEIVQEAQQEDPHKEIAILVRNRSHLSDIIPALHEANIAWQATEIDPLNTCMIIQDLLSLTRALLQPADRIAWLAVLRAPWCGLSLADLHSLAAADSTAPLFTQLQQYQSLPALSAEGAQRLARVETVFTQAFQQQGRKPLRSWIEGVWLALGGPACVITLDELNHVPVYFDLLAKHEMAGQLDVAVFEEAVGKLYSAASHPDANLHIMTIHKAKGLEFDTVILPGLDRGSAGDDKALLLWQEYISREGEKHLLLGPLAPIGDYNDPLYNYLQHENKVKQQLENTRLLYIATTRAINKLHLLAHAKTDDKTDTIKPPTRRSLLAPIWETVKEEFNWVAVEETDTATEHTIEIDFEPTHIRRLPQDWQHPIAVPEPPALSLPEDNPLNHPVLDWPTTAQHIGTVVHRCLEQIVKQGIDLWTPAYCEEKKGSWAAQLRTLGVPNHEQEEATQRIYQAITQTLDDPKGRWLLDNTHQDSACELPLSGSSRSGRVRHSIIDRTFIDEKGVRWIIDYKTSSPTSQETQAFIDAEVTSYRDQLETYGKLFQAMGAQKVQMALYFPLLSHFETIDSTFSEANLSAKAC